MTAPNNSYLSAASSRVRPNQRLIGISPLEVADARLVLALCRAGALGVLDLGRDRQAAAAALARVAREAPGAFGVRVPEGMEWDPVALPAAVDVVIVAAGAPISAWRPRTVLVQVTSVAEARAAADAGADGLIVKGAESGGRVGEETSFVLLQRVAQASALPLWVQGGVGVHTAAACVAGGAAGVVLDAQLALVRESALPEPVKAALRAMDGSETVIAAGHRLFTRPDLPIASAPPASVEEVLPRLGGVDLTACLLPIGQDAAFARPLADQYRTASGVVHALRAAIDEHLRDAHAHKPLAEGAPLAVEHGIRYPIAQGPMTRVSDRAAFADAVSRAGGLPFLALSLLRGEEVRELLTETRALLGDRAFGVGILGFVPEDLREEQLAVLRELPPPAAIIAGGRPSQARPLEVLGTLTYLHVPSPGLLDLFLKDGARSFVFEGRECGGHVGPRTSFVLWELAVSRLLAFLDEQAQGESGARSESQPLSVLFAGGIHDACSAAMVAALAAPLAARGARVGVLMGTAYLFTDEAVATGAILPAFQEAALRCDGTVLLETAPGHATRCVGSAYVQAFSDEKARMERDGKSPEEIWAALEALNVGRLRIAAKGLRREGAALVAVSEDELRREGMFMIGQVAALRSGTCTMAELHRDVCDGAAERIALLSPGEDAEVEAGPGPADVAIVGIACIFPDAADRHAFWANITSGRDSITEVPAERWDVGTYFDPSASGGDKSCSKWGGFIPAVPFDPLAYGIPPRSLASIEPVQLLSLEVARRALEDAGYGDQPGLRRAFCRERTSVIFGAEAGTDLSAAYGFRALYPQYAGPLPAPLAEHLPSLTEDSFPGVLANVIAGRIANRLDLGGVNYTVDAACASSLAALDLAVKELVGGTSDMVLCGGADLHNSINDYLMFSSVHALSPTGACRTFDASADGIALGEGVACVVLKRLADAERDGDRIYAVIKSVAGGSDGRSLGLTAPRKEGQARALARAYSKARVSPAEVGLVEAHGTGTVVGDRTELETLTEVFQRAGAGRGAVALGSVKSQIGHTKCSAGLAGLIKAALALHHRALPPTLHVKRPNASYDAATSPFAFSDATRPWPGEGRKAAVSAFGFGGTNFHAVLSAYEGAGSPASGLDRWPAELFLFRASDLSGALRDVAKVAAALPPEDVDFGVSTCPQTGFPVGAPYGLADLARSVSERQRGRAPVQVAIVASSLGELREKLGRAAAREAGAPGVFFRGAEPETAGKVAFVFPGQGSQRPGMLADLFVAFPALQRYLELGAGEGSGPGSSIWAERMFPPLATTPEARAAQAAALTDTRSAQPALGIAALALAEVLRGCNVRPDMAAGHSYGELAALCVAGALREVDLLPLSEARGESILAAAGAEPGTMAAVSAAPSAVAALIEGLDGVVTANHNAPEQTVISGPTAGVEEAIRRLAAAGIPARTISVACAFHSPVVASASARLAERLATMPVKAPRLPVFSNATAAPYPADPDAVRGMLAEHVALPVRFVDEVEAMYAAGARTFVEVGPGRVLTGLVGRILAGRPHVAVACDQSGEHGLKQLLEALARLAAAGVSVDAAPLFAGRAARTLDLDRLPALRPADAAWVVNGQLARPLVGEAPKNALRPTPAPLVTNVASTPLAAAAAEPGDERRAAVLEFLRSTREIVAAQRQVMLGFLGADAAAELSLAPAVLPPSAAASRPASSRPAVSRPPTSRPATSRPARATPSSAGATMRAGPRASAPPSIAAPQAAKLPGESAAWMREIEGAGSAPAGAGRDIQGTLLAIVSERTGYPIEMLDLDLNLEADLSIDSIKRIEILGTLGSELGLGFGAEGKDKRPGASNVGSGAELGESRDKIIEQLATIKTLRGIVEWLEVRKAGGASAEAAPAKGGEAAQPMSPRSEVRAKGSEAPARPGVQRYALSVEDAPAILGMRPGAAPLAGRAYAIARDGAGIAEELVALIEARGGHATLLDDGAEPPRGGLHGLVDLGCFAAQDPVAPLKALFERAHAAIGAGVQTIVAATHLGAPFGGEGERPRAGVAGLVKSLAKEAPLASVRAVGLDPREPARRLAEQVCTELCATSDHVEIAYVGGTRRALVAAPTDAIEQGTRGAPIELGPEAVVLVTGGARGITAAAAVALATRFRCRVELVGRSPLPEGAEDPAFAAAEDRPALRRAILASGAASAPAAVEALCAKILAAREIRGTLERIAKAGATVRYHAVDVRDDAAFGALIDGIYAQYGRLDGVVHGAGITEDKLLAQKTRESFDRVFDTKVKSALTLAERLRKDVSFVALFASISGAFGNRGQVDYAAANDALDKLAWWLKERVSGRVIALDWGPWGGGGMVSPELAREYARRGMGLIEPEDGVRCFLEELIHGGVGAQVILANAELGVLSGAAAEEQARAGARREHALRAAEPAPNGARAPSFAAHSNA